MGTRNNNFFLFFINFVLEYTLFATASGFWHREAVWLCQRASPLARCQSSGFAWACAQRYAQRSGAARKDIYY